MRTEACSSEGSRITCRSQIPRGKLGRDRYSRAARMAATSRHGHRRRTARRVARRCNACAVGVDGADGSAGKMTAGPVSAVHAVRATPISRRYNDARGPSSSWVRARTYTASGAALGVRSLRRQTRDGAESDRRGRARARGTSTRIEIDLPIRGPLALLTDRGRGHDVRAVRGRIGRRCGRVVNAARERVPRLDHRGVFRSRRKPGARGRAASRGWILRGALGNREIAEPFARRAAHAGAARSRVHAVGVRIRHRRARMVRATRQRIAGLRAGGSGREMRTRRHARRRARVLRMTGGTRTRDRAAIGRARGGNRSVHDGVTRTTRRE